MFNIGLSNLAPRHLLATPVCLK